MAKRTLSRRALREQNDVVEAADHDRDEETDDAGETPVEKKPRARKASAKPRAAKGPPKPRAPRKKTVKVPPRMFARWAVCDNGMKRVALFEYKDRAAADAKLTELRERKSGFYCLQLVKDACVLPEPATV